jgi:hypothetical protein
MRTRTILLLWLVIFVAFGVYGFGRGLSNQSSYLPFDWKDALEPTIMFSAVGLCFGAYLSIGLMILKLVKRERLYRVWAVLLLALLGALAIPGPTYIVLFAMDATVSGIRLYQKELFYFPILAYYVMCCIAGGTFLVLAVCVSCVTNCPLLTRSLHRNRPHSTTPDAVTS